MNIIDKLIKSIIIKKNPTVIGLDPDIIKIPDCYKAEKKNSDKIETVTDVIYEFNKNIIDTVADLVPAVKPQIAFYEKYGFNGLKVFEKTIRYAKSKDLIVIDDSKRCDIGNTAEAYADGHLGTVDLLNGTYTDSINADFLTVTPFLGSESIHPFIDKCIEHDKGIFILVKTSNTSSGEIQNIKTPNGFTVSQNLARYVSQQSKLCKGIYGYSSIGAVVGATYPEEAMILRRIMEYSYFLVPGYGAQGGNATDVLPAFNPDGLGAIVNSSRGILYTHMTDQERSSCTRESYLKNVRNECLKMREEIYATLKREFKDMVY